MKTVIKSTTALIALVLLSTGVFAAAKMSADTVKKDQPTISPVSAVINYDSNNTDIDINIDKAVSGESMVTIYDASGTVLLNDKFTSDTPTIKKSYSLGDIEDGDYTISVISNDQVSKSVVTLSSY